MNMKRNRGSRNESDEVVEMKIVEKEKKTRRKANTSL